MTTTQFDFSSIGAIYSIAEDLTETGDDLMQSIGADLMITYNILRLKQKLAEGSIDEHTYTERLLELV